MDDAHTRAWAEALHAISVAEGDPDETADELFRFARVLENNDELANRLADPTLPPALRQQIVTDLLGEKATGTTTHLIGLVVGTGRIRDLGTIVSAMLESTAARAGREVAEVRSAIDLDDDQKARLAEALGQATGKHIEVRVIVDTSIKGGIVAHIGDTVIDGSVRRRLEQLRKSL